jgi:hypothetical protein
MVSEMLREQTAYFSMIETLINWRNTQKVVDETQCCFHAMLVTAHILLMRLFIQLLKTVLNSRSALKKKEKMLDLLVCALSTKQF